MSPLARKLINEAVLKAIGVCMEGMPTDAIAVLGRRQVRRLVLLYVHEFAKSHGVILDDEDILDALDEHVRTRRATSEMKPIAPRDCTCVGSCKGAAGLAPGWRCAIESPPLQSHREDTNP